MGGDGNTGQGYSPAEAGLAGDLLLALRGTGRRCPLVVGLSGLQGSGKSTLAGQLAASLARRKVTVQVLSLDDFYLPKAARKRLAASVHPLLATRGVPGTHDLPLLEDALARLGSDTGLPLRLPVFDKGLDDRLPRAQWRTVSALPQLIVLEGWCVGLPPGGTGPPLNPLEEHEDPDGRWRRFIEAQLAGPYARLWSRLHRLVVLQAPGWEVVTRWRDQAEQARRMAGAPAALDAAALARFLMHYERLSRRALATLPAKAQLVLELDAHRRIRRVVRAPAGGGRYAFGINPPGS